MEISIYRNSTTNTIGYSILRRGYWPFHISRRLCCNISSSRNLGDMSANFHVAWTGVVELLGGSGLLFGGLRSSLMGILKSNEGMEEEEEDGLSLIKLIQPISAATLFLLTVLVTPASMCVPCEFGLFNMKYLYLAAYHFGLHLFAFANHMY